MLESQPIVHELTPFLFFCKLLKFRSEIIEMRICIGMVLVSYGHTDRQQTEQQI